ncbi:DUF4910 domain-containing protein [Rhodohalobacter mucosus]|uniref:Peptidase M28 n=1 Tax=Rhodohalobacter mucosus TaxID=2079485 RepID=A0A316TWQ6_9BACT|nr:DUF4910 domain-containing protein [Rhodohalobacter mucosus]PWN07819.1 peptidase M28 [Rhodohalobacter mucosus]
MSRNRDYGKSMHQLIGEMYPICRSITGNGVRETLEIIRSRIPLEVVEIPTGEKVFDWQVPKEWNINEAWIKDSAGRKIVDFADLNLHVMSYSIPVNKKVTLSELKKHLFSLPEQPGLVPHKTSYFSEHWGFCMTHNQLKALEEDTYHVYIDSSLKEGSLTYGELFIEGETREEVLISTHTCHPSLCNDNLSGISIAVHLAEQLLKQYQLRYSYRFLFIPATIGAITWLAKNEKVVDKIKYGLILSCLGDPGRSMTFKKSRSGEADIDRIVEKALSDTKGPYEIREFEPVGYDERQFCSPGFNLPVGLLMRTPYGEFPEYHTSADNPDFVRPESLADSLSKLEEILYIIEHNDSYLNQNPRCEPFLGKRGLYSLSGGKNKTNIDQEAVLWTLNYSDGEHSLLDISRKSGLSFRNIARAAEALMQIDLLKPAE